MIISCKAVIFDLDGTLLDTLDDLADAMNTVLSRFGFPEHSPQAYKKFVGEGIRVMVSRALPEEKRDEEILMRCVNAMREEYGSCWDNKTRIYTGIPELLDRLASKGIPMSVLSNKPHHFTGIMVERLLGSWNFTCVFGEKDGIRKPDPSRALEIASSLGIEPERICVLGDTWTDMETAQRSGMLPLGALWGFRTSQELLDSGAVALIEHPLELLDYLD